MSKFIIGLAFSSLADAAGFLNHLGTLNIPGEPQVVHTPVPVAASPAPQFTPQPQPAPQVGFGAPPAPVFTPQPGPAPAFTPQPQPGFTPAPNAGPQPGFQPQPAGASFASPTSGYTLQTVLPLMQQYIATYKAPAAKAAFAKFGLPSTLPQLDQNGLNTMGAFFAAMQPA